MPGNAENTRGVLEWIAKNLGPETYLSLMDQYQPAYRAFARGDIGRAILLEEFEQARDSAIQLGLTRLDDHLLMSNAKEDMSHG
jgi:putative pyruvate formate lyase activating enzyme